MYAFKSNNGSMSLVGHKKKIKIGGNLLQTGKRREISVSYGFLQTKTLKVLRKN